MLIVYGYPQDQPVSAFYFGMIMLSTVLSSFMSTVQFVSISAFMTGIADPVIGGTYMTVSFFFIFQCVIDNVFNCNIAIEYV